MAKFFTLKKIIIFKSKFFKLIYQNKLNPEKLHQKNNKNAKKDCYVDY